MPQPRRTDFHYQRWLFYGVFSTREAHLTAEPFVFMIVTRMISLLFSLYSLSCSVPKVHFPISSSWQSTLQAPFLNLCQGVCTQQQQDGVDDVGRIFISRVRHLGNSVHQFWLCVSTKHRCKKHIHLSCDQTLAMSSPKQSWIHIILSQLSSSLVAGRAGLARCSKDSLGCDGVKVKVVSAIT